MSRGTTNRLVVVCMMLQNYYSVFWTYESFKSSEIDAWDTVRWLTMSPKILFEDWIINILVLQTCIAQLSQSESEDSLELEEEEEEDSCFLFFCFFFPWSLLFFLLFFLWLFSFFFFFLCRSSSSEDECDLLCFFFFFVVSSSLDDDADLGRRQISEKSTHWHNRLIYLRMITALLPKNTEGILYLFSLKQLV